MKTFMDEDFLLSSDTAKKLYHEYAEKMPIYDYHCHLPIQEIYENRHYDNATQLWLVDGHFGDHYKWRALRNNGVEEKYITGNASDEEKFLKWAETVPMLFGNPLYHWTHLELKRYFGITKPFSEKNAKEVYQKMNDFLKTHGARDIIAMSNVDTLCTTDDPIDDLHFHKALSEDKTFKTKVYPAFRPDKILNIQASSYLPYVKQLENIVGYKIASYSLLLKALDERIDFFHEAGCRISDHSLEVVSYAEASQAELEEIFHKAYAGEKLSQTEIEKYKGNLLVYLGKQYARHHWVQQYHIKALRNNSTRMFEAIGPDIGYDSINDGKIAEKLSKILNEMDKTGELPKTIVYSLNPSDNEVLAALVFSFGEGGVPGKMQLGSGWWFNDQKDGMERQLTALSNLGLLSRFVGMLTDSRSFLSYTRHEYFRRILCNKVASVLDNGEYPYDIDFAGKMVEDICFNNAKKYFDADR